MSVSKVSFGNISTTVGGFDPSIASQPQAYTMQPTASTGITGKESKKGSALKTIGWIAAGIVAVGLALGLGKKYVLTGEYSKAGGLMEKTKYYLAAAGDWVNKKAASAWGAITGLFKKEKVEQVVENVEQAAEQVASKA